MAAGLLKIFGNFPLGMGAGKCLVCRWGWPFRGAPKSREGAEDFDEFGKNIPEKFSKIE